MANTNIIGKRFGRLTAIRLLDDRSRDGHLMAEWQCECGQIKSIPASRVVNGATVSCGCYAKEKSREANIKHGGRFTVEYAIWLGIKQRCLNPKAKDFARYGGNGITMHKSWQKDFHAFVSHIGKRPKTSFQIDRINNKKGYIPGNVRWATRKEQQRNRKSACVWHIKGLVFQSAQEAADYFKVSKHTVWRWVRGAFDARRNSFTPPREDCNAINRY